MEGSNAISVNYVETEDYLLPWQ